MPDSSEFVAFIASKSGVDKLTLVEQDILIHHILLTLNGSPGFKGRYLFKGGGCLVKCYYGYYRFSVDLDFTWRNQEHFKVSGNELQRRLRAEALALGEILERIAELLGLEFRNDPSDRRYFEFGGSKRTVTFKLWRGRDMIKVQVNFVEELLFPVKQAVARTLLDGMELKADERAYFDELLSHYAPFEVEAYDEREILCEKVRAVLTRRAQKLRDFYDLFILDRHGFAVDSFTDEIVRKTRASLYYRKYRENLEANRRAMELDPTALESPFERGMFIVEPPPEFDKFIQTLLRKMREITPRI